MTNRVLRPQGKAASMVLQLNSELRSRLQRWAEEEYPHERCGLLLGRTSADVVRVEDVLPARNVNARRAGDRYELDPQDFLGADEQARARQLDIVGIWHTHPDHPARPSETDRAQAWEAWSYLILSVGAAGVQSMRSWRLNGHDFVEEAVRT